MPEPVAASGLSSVTLPIHGLDCAVCAESLAAGLRNTPGVQDASVNFGAGAARIAFDATTSRSNVVERVAVLGYTVPLAAQGTPLRYRVRGMADLVAMAADLDRLEPNPSGRPPILVPRPLWPWPAAVAGVAALTLGMLPFLRGLGRGVRPAARRVSA